ncbi:hypothetical protein V6N13_117740 [Hibiscus sabdariffa]
MPYMKAILVNATDKSNRMLRAKSMECISRVRMAVGKEKFRDDAKQEMRNVCFVAQNMQSLMQSKQASMARGFIGFSNNYSSVQVQPQKTRSQFYIELNLIENVELE